MSLNLQRFPDWPARLNLWVAKALFRRFKWGENDCMLHVSDGIAAITGHDYAASWRGKYSTPREAQEILNTMGDGSILAFMRAVGGPSVHPHFMRRGDACCVLQGGRQTGAICIGEHILFCTPRRTEKRTLKVSEAIILATWRAG